MFLIFAVGSAVESNMGCVCTSTCGNYLRFTVHPKWCYVDEGTCAEGSPRQASWFYNYYWDHCDMPYIHKPTLTQSASSMIRYILKAAIASPKFSNFVVVVVLWRMSERCWPPRTRDAARRAQRNRGILEVDFSTRYHGPSFAFSVTLYQLINNQAEAHGLGDMVVAHNPNDYNKRDCEYSQCMGNCRDNMRKPDWSIINVPGRGNGQTKCWKKSFRFDHLRRAAVMVQIETEDGLTGNQVIETSHLHDPHQQWRLAAWS